MSFGATALGDSPLGTADGVEPTTVLTAAFNVPFTCSAVGVRGAAATVTSNMLALHVVSAGFVAPAGRGNKAIGFVAQAVGNTGVVGICGSKLPFVWAAHGSFGKVTTVSATLKLKGVGLGKHGVAGIIGMVLPFSVAANCTHWAINSGAVALVLPISGRIHGGQFFPVTETPDRVYVLTKQSRLEVWV